jgi:hypothetical protein
MGLPASLAGQVKRVKIFFFGVQNGPDSGGVSYAYVRTPGLSLPERKVLAGMASGDGDGTASSNTVLVDVNSDGEFECRVNVAFNRGFFADVQGYEIGEPIL